MKKIALLFLLNFYNVQAMEQSNQELQQQNTYEKKYYFFSYKPENHDVIMIADITKDTSEKCLQMKTRVQNARSTFRYQNYDVYGIIHKSVGSKLNPKQFKSYVQHDISKKEIQKTSLDDSHKNLITNIISLGQHVDNCRFHEEAKQNSAAKNIQKSFRGFASRTRTKK